MEIKGKKVLITGGARRVGAALTRAFRERGAEVVIHCRRSRREAEALAAELGGCRVVECDLADIGAAERLLDAAGPVDVLINNASRFVYPLPSLARESSEEVRLNFAVNLFAPLALIRSFAGQDLPEGGCVVNFLDQEVARPTPRGGAYSLSRRALRDATLEMACELAPRIRVNGIAPGPVLPPPGYEESRMKKTLPTLPLARPVALDDLVAGVLFLVGNDSLTGEILHLDCGQHL